jgi:formylglycine-generating enzyme required for sulfatase activity
LVCKRIRGPLTETCDGLDNDCDGQLDETFAQQGELCQTGQPGQCADGSKQCVSAQISCEPLNPASAEACDGADNDCDGLVDEDASGMALATSCGAATCPGRGVSLCIGAQWTACDLDSHEICDGADSNCDSQVDNLTPCYAACPGGNVAVGTLDCSTGTGSCELPQEICNDGADNDCDGQIDENCQNGNARDGMVFVPGGPFWMGSQAASFGFQQDESPQHLVELAPFYIDQAEVTRRQYRSCFGAGSCSLPQLSCPYMGAGSTTNRLEKPMGCLTYSQAEDYCQWAGKRLPTAAEWEKAARGPYPRTDLFPWGDVQDATLAVVGCPDGLNDCSAESLSYPQGASYYGALHMAGNVAEWVTDYYDPNFYTSAYTVAPEQTSGQGYGHEVRGGSYDQSLQYARVSNRAALSFATVDEDAVGFRCVMDAP